MGAVRKKWAQVSTSEVDIFSSVASKSGAISIPEQYLRPLEILIVCPCRSMLGESSHVSKTTPPTLDNQGGGEA